VADLVLGVVVDVLGHVPVELLEGRRVGRAAAPAGDLAVLDPPELVVLLPQVGLEDLRRCQEPEDRRVTVGVRRAGLGQRETIAQEPRTDGAPAPSATLVPRKERRFASLPDDTDFWTTTASSSLCCVPSGRPRALSLAGD
jgi:hypothetical protein